MDADLGGGRALFAPSSGATAMKLYHSPGACSMACHIALLDAGADFEAIRVLLAEGEHRSPAYRAINPRGLVPVLEIEGGQRITEAAAILLHIARRFPDARLLPEAGSPEEARAFEWLAWLTNTMHIAYACLWRPERFTDAPPAREALVAGARDRIDALNRDVETRIAEAPFAAGTAYSVVDAFLLVFFRWANRIGLDAAERYPAWTAWARRTEVRPAAARVLEREGISLWGS
jgi:glutathione S-transferase